MRLASYHKYTPLAIICLLIGCGVISAAQDEPRIIKVIGTGKAEGMPIVTAWFTTEPSTDPIIIPTRAFGGVTSCDIVRVMRLYFPRTYEGLLDYEFYFMAQVDMQFFGPKEEKWLYDALIEHQKGAVNTRSVMSGGSRLNIPWRDSILSQAFPNNAPAAIANLGKGQAGRLVIDNRAEIPNIMKAFKEPIESIFGRYSGLYTVPKPGSVILSYTENQAGLGHPIPGQIAHVFYWRWNRSITFTFQDMVYNAFWSSVYSGGQSNPYALDIIANIVWFSTGRELPADPWKVHDFRRDLFDFRIRKSLLLSLLDFAEGFGANPSREYEHLAQIEASRSKASDFYLDGDFDGAYSEMKYALDRVSEIEAEATELKNRALLWVYVVEWTVTTGVFLLAGFVLWTLMVKRALYREVGQTRGI